MSGPTNPPQSTSGFLSFNSLPSRLWITAEPDIEEDFDQTTIQHWREEGYDVTYLPLRAGGKDYLARLKTLPDDLELGETFALIAYGDAATLCLHAVTKPLAHLCTLVCYYPTSLPHPDAKYPTQLKLTLHLTVSQGLAPKSSKFFAYSDVEPGFAEHDCDEFSPVAADLAWSRTLAAVRKGFKKDESEKIEAVWDQQQLLRNGQKNAAAAVGQMAQDAEATYIPTLTGANGQKELYKFYKDFFVGRQPPSLKTRLLSRTVGVDRVVDEMIMSFRHDKEVPWILPNTPPTNKNVEIAVVSVVTVRGGKLVHEHVYWDQASVLVQVGLLDPAVVPGHMKKQGMQRLPVTGVEQAARLRNPNAVAVNEVLSGWKEEAPAKQALPVRGGRKSQRPQISDDDEPPPTPTPTPKSNVRGGRPPKQKSNGQTPNARGRAQA